MMHQSLSGGREATAQRTNEKKGKGEIIWQKTKYRLQEEKQYEDIQSASLLRNME